MSSRLLELPKQAGVDVIVAVSPENFAYVSKTHIITVKMIPPRQAYSVISRDGKAALVLCSIEKTLAASQSWVKDIDTYTEFVDDPIDALVATLKERFGFESGRLGIDLQYLPQTSYARLRQRLPDAEILDTTAVIARMRAIKDDEEVRALEFAAKGTWQAVIDAMEQSHVGESEKTVANRIAHGIVENGADTNAFMCFASGDRTNQAHAHPTEKVLTEGEIIRFDVGGTYGLWTSDFARTYSTGNPSQLQLETYRALRKVEEETIKMVRPGVTAEEVFYSCKDSFAKHGIAFHMPHIGHSFGHELHENPMLRPGDKTRIEAGMVLNIEPFALDEHNHGYHIEDLILVSEDGPRILTGGLPPKELPIIGQPIEQ